MSDFIQLFGDARQVLKDIDAESVQCCVTSPPYFGLRSYLANDHPSKQLEIGLEKTPEEYVANLVEVFGSVWRVLRDDGVLWLNLGDSYCSQGGDHGGRNDNQANVGAKYTHEAGKADRGPRKPMGNVKAKDLYGIPWMVAFALRNAGWYLRSDIIWAKPNCMPESVTDRCTKSHEYIFMLSKSQKYYYDAQAIAEPASDALYEQVEQGYNGEGQKDYAGAGVQNASSVKARIIANARKRADRFGGNKHNGDTTQHSDGSIYTGNLTRNKRTVWSCPTAVYKEAHFATFSPALILPCILAGSRAGDIVLDPFGGSGTTAAVALEYGRKAIICDLDEGNKKLHDERCRHGIGLGL